MKNVRKNQGFSLVEVSIVLVIVGLLLGSVITGFITLRENSLIEQAQDDLKLIHEALVGYAIQNRRLPCPDDDGPGVATFGQEDQANCNAAGAGSVVLGFLPFQDLGLAGVAADPWGNAYAYAVDAGFADLGAVGPTACAGATPNITFGTCDLGNLRIYDTGGIAPGGCNLPCTIHTERAVAVFYSFGTNGFATASVHEQENLASGGGGPGSDPNDLIYVSRQYANTGPNQFDDQIMWIPSTILVGQMVKASQLP